MTKEDRAAAGMSTLTADLAPEQLAKLTARTVKKCRFGQQHAWVFEYDIATERNTGWCVCSRCDVRDWEGE